MLLYASAQRKHHEEKGNGGNQCNLADADAHMLADRHSPEHSGSDGGDGVDDRLGLQNGVALVGIVGQRNDHGLHGDFHQCIAQIIQQIENKEPRELSACAPASRHTEKQRCKNGKQEKGQPVPRQVFSFAGHLLKGFPLRNMNAVHQITEDHIVKGINDLNDQHGSGNGSHIDPLEDHEGAHHCGNDIALQRPAKISDDVAAAFFLCGSPALLADLLLCFSHGGSSF